MIRSLWARFFILLLVVTLLGLSASLYLRHMMLADFGQYLEGEMLDRVYRVTAGLEGSYEQRSGWDDNQLRKELIRALMMGMVTTVLDESGKKLINTAEAVEGLTPLMKRRVLSLVDMNSRNPSGEPVPFPLFLGGKRIGTLMVQFFPRDRANLFTQRSVRFLMIAFVMLGGLAVIASLVFSRMLTAPIKKLESQTRSIREGDYTARVDISNIGEIGSLSRSFNEMADDLQLLESLRRKLISNIAHELRTPLAAMTAELEAMADGILPMDMDRVRSLHEETTRLGVMLDGIDDLTQAQASSLNLSLQQVNLPQIMENVVNRFEIQAGEKGVKLEVSGKDENVYADPDRLSQILINLVSNAVRAVADGGTVSLHCGREGDSAYLEVDDTGPGIPGEDLPHIFERFYSGPGGGLGLGLSIVRELVDAHNGEIEIESKEGKGTRVRVTLPSGPQERT